MQTNGINGGERMYLNSSDCVHKLLKSEGIPAFFRGFSVDLVRVIPGAGIQFVAYETLKIMLNIK